LRAIVDGAAELFDQRGYERVSMEDIAAAVGVRKPTLYHYVHGKDEILALIHREFMSLVTSRADSRRALPLSAGQELLELMADILELMHTHRGHVRAFFEHQWELPENVRAAVRQERDGYEAMVEAVVRRGVEAGEFRQVDVRLATLAMFGMCNWAYKWYRHDGPLRTREIAYTFWDMLMCGMLPREDDRSSDPSAD
jgi:AcrR family transcriptional regulator